MYTLNPYFRIRLGPPAVIDLLLDNKQVELPHPYYIQFMPYMENGGTLNELKKSFSQSGKTEEQISEILDFFIENKVLVTDVSGYDLDAVRHWIDRGWGAALQLHLKTQCLTYADDNDPEAIKIFPENFSVDFWKEYEGKKVVELPPPAEVSQRSLEDILLSRRTGKINIGRQLEVSVLSSILKQANKETLEIRSTTEKDYKEKPEVLYNSNFTAQETYVAIYDVEGIQPGIYFYDLKKHVLILIQEGDFREEIGRFCIGQRYAGMGACSFLISAVWERYMKRYSHSRAYRNLLVNTAELAHKYILLATSYKLGNFLTPALNDETSVDLIGEPMSKETVLYVVTIG